MFVCLFNMSIAYSKLEQLSDLVEVGIMINDEFGICLSL